MVEVAIIIVNYYTSKQVQKIVENIKKKVKVKNYKIVVVDNNSDYTKLKNIKGIKLINLKENIGFAGGNNIGIKSITAKYYCLVNPDIELVNDAVSILKNSLKQCKKYGIAGPLILKENMQKQIEYYKFGDALYEISKIFKLHWIYHLNYKQKLQNRISIVDWVTGAFFMIKKSVIEDIGLMDESYFLYSEESDYCWKAKQNGWKVVYVKDAKVKHYENVSTLKNSGFRLYYQYKSKLKFVRKHFGFTQFFVLKIFYFFDIITKLIIRGFLEIIQKNTHMFSLFYWKLLKEFIKNEV